jgi:hypothetical protein
MCYQNVDKISQMILALLVHCQESLTVLTSVLMERRKSLASPFSIHHLVVSLENADQNPVRAKSPDGVYCILRWLACTCSTPCGALAWILGLVLGLRYLPFSPLHWRKLISWLVYLRTSLHTIRPSSLLPLVSLLSWFKSFCLV